MDPLKSPRVVDFSTHFSGPVAARQMAQLGADVIKVEHPVRGDGNRDFPPRFREEGIHHLCLNPGTRSVTASPRSSRWPTVVEALTKWADVVIVGNRPERARAIGIDPASLLKHNQNLIYCLLSGYGIAGDWSALPAHGLNMDALAGTLPLEWTDDKPSIPRGYRSVGTTLAGVEAALGIYAALHRRSRGGGGQVVQVSIWESALAWMWRDVGTYANTQQAWPEYADFGSRYAVYATADKKGLLVCPIERGFWERFCDTVGLSNATRARGDWTSGTDLGAAYVALGEADAIQRQLSLKSRDEWVASLAAADVPIAPVLDWREAMSSSHAEANGALFDYEYAGNHVRTPATPVSITPSSAVSGDVMQALADAHRRKIDGLARPPYLGEHNAQVSREIGVEIDGQ